MGKLQEANLYFRKIGGVWDSLKNALHLGDAQVKRSPELGCTVGRSGCGSFWRE